MNRMNSWQQQKTVQLYRLDGSSEELNGAQTDGGLDRADTG